MVVIGLFVIILVSNTFFILLHGYTMSKVIYLFFNIRRIGTGKGYVYLTSRFLPALLLINAGVLLYIFIYYYTKDRFEHKYREYNYNQKFRAMDEASYRSMVICGWFVYANFSAILSLAIITLGVDLK